MADVTLLFSLVLRPRALALGRAPSRAFADVLGRAAAAHPRAMSEAVLKPLATSSGLNLSQLELLRRVTAKGSEISKLNLALLLQVASGPEPWRENQVLLMQHLVQAAPPGGGAQQKMAVEATCEGLRANTEGFSASLHFAKLANTLIKKHPAEAKAHRKLLLEAMEANTTFLAKVATSNAQKL